MRERFGEAGIKIRITRFSDQSRHVDLTTIRLSLVLGNDKKRRCSTTVFEAGGKNHSSLDMLSTHRTLPVVEEVEIEHLRIGRDFR